MDELIELKKAYDKTIKEQGERLIKREISKVLEQLPQVHYIQWTQYTPYFNDGEPCVFGVGEVEAYDEQGKELGDYTKKDDVYRLVSEWRGEESLSSKFSNCSDALEMVFGDHAEVTDYRDRLEVSEYEHD